MINILLLTHKELIKNVYPRFIGIDEHASSQIVISSIIRKPSNFQVTYNKSKSLKVTRSKVQKVGRM